jgi:hypothetical protein
MFNGNRCGDGNRDGNNGGSEEYASASGFGHQIDTSNLRLDGRHLFLWKAIGLRRCRAKEKVEDIYWDNRDTLSLKALLLLSGMEAFSSSLP